MNLADFKIVILSTDHKISTERIARLRQYFKRSNIGEYSISVVAVDPPLGGTKHFAKILRTYTGNLLCFEDDAIVFPDFVKRFEKDLANLPEEWEIFIPGYTQIFQVKKEVNNYRQLAEFHGTQCIAYRNNFSYMELSAAIYNSPGGLDCMFYHDPEVQHLKIFCPQKSYVGQGGSPSIQTGKMQSTILYDSLEAYTAEEQNRFLISTC